MNKRAIIYARVSTDRQRDQNQSIPDQITQCLEYINRKGYQLVGNVLVDRLTGQETDENNPNGILAFVDDYSAENYPRPATNAALDFYDNSGGYEIMVCKVRDRFSRSHIATAYMENDFIHIRGIKIEFVDGMNYADTPEAGLFAGIEDTWAQYENIRRAKRSKDGKLHYAKEQGKIRSGGRPPIGYTFDKESLGGLKIDEEKSEIVKMIFSLYAKENKSIRGIAEYLNEQRFEPFLGGMWRKSTIHNILGNKCYVGTVIYNKRRRIKNRITNKVIIKERDSSEWIEFPCEPIIEKDVWNITQNKLKKNREVSRNTSRRFYMLSGMVFCKECGKPYVSQTALPNAKKRPNEIKFYRHRTKEGHCQNHAVSSERVENFAWDKIKQFLLHPEVLREGYERALEIEQEKYKADFLLLDQTKKRQESLAKKKQNLLQLRTDPDLGNLISNEDFSFQWKNIESEIKNNDSIIKELDIKLSKLPSELKFDSIEKFAYEVRSRLEDDNWKPTARNKRRVFELLNVEVLINEKAKLLQPENIEIKGYFIDGLLSRPSTHLGQQTYYFYLPAKADYAEVV